ncbi:hypothetical protein [Streptomyces sp. cmx-4-25]|uniref:hypothetical protein n=1 Tax=unclassified Streptomyces TaxID=2593676 RepID=UPI003980BF48
MTGELKTGVDALKKFRDRVDGIIADLASGPGGAAGLGRDQMKRASLGVGIPFTEADGFFAEYHRVHTALVSLSKSLSGQIELLQIGVHAADVGYGNVEDEQRRRFHEIRARLDHEREEAVKREQEARSSDPAQPAQAREDTESGKKDLG